MSLLEIRNLSVEFETVKGTFRAVDGVDLSIDETDILSIVGESGSGKSVSMLASQHFSFPRRLLLTKSC